MTTPEHLPQNIILCGFMGTGKSSVGRILAERLGWQFVDTDALIEQREGRTISAIFAEDGEAKFRDLESAVAAELVNYLHTVIATGGGIVLRPENLANLDRAGLVVCLDAPAEEIARRLAQFTDRPLLAGADPAARIAELLARRKGAYGAIRQHVDTANRSVEQIAAFINELWQDSHVSLEAENPGRNKNSET
ncbi:MAG TPA: shikimate kinase [Aggregatilineales bacterium]|nr:shikimate kinase [Aggregatilineales bacterium]